MVIIGPSKEIGNQTPGFVFTWIFFYNCQWIFVFLSIGKTQTSAITNSDKSQAFRKQIRSNFLWGFFSRLLQKNFDQRSVKFSRSKIAEIKWTFFETENKEIVNKFPKGPLLKETFKKRLMQNKSSRVETNLGFATPKTSTSLRKSLSKCFLQKASQVVKFRGLWCVTKLGSRFCQSTPCLL